MARKKRTIPEQFKVVENKDTAKKAAYRDEFQTTVGRQIEGLGKKFEGNGKSILYGIAAVAVLAVLIGIFFAWNRRSNAQAQTALGKAIETSTAQVTDSPVPAGSTAKTFKTEKERSEAAITEFQAVADKFSGEVGDKAKYFVAVNKLKIDKPTAIQELETLAQKSGEVGTLSKFALAQTKADGGDLDGAVGLYSALAGLDNPILSKDTINFELAKIYEKQGKKDDAVNLYFNIVKAASEAKDLDDKPVPLSETAKKAKEKLTQLNPEKAKEIPEPAPLMPTSMPFGM